MITISHNHESGTLIEGSVKGDGVYEIARQHGFRYFPSVDAIGIRNSRDHVANRYRINGCAAALRAAGHDVTVDIDDQHRDRAEVLADQAERLDGRADALNEKAIRCADQARALWDHSDRLVEHIPPGQPILVGHHSERGHRRLLQLSQNAASRAVAVGAEARRVAGHAEVVGKAAERSATPAVTARRIERAETELRDIDRKLNGYTRNSLNGRGEVVYVERHNPATGEWAESLQARRAQLVDQIAYDRAAVAAAVAAGTHKVWNKDTVHVGDVVSTTWESARLVVKINKVTVAVETGYSWTDKVRYTDILRVRCPHSDEN